MQVVMVQRDVLPEHREAFIAAARAYGRACRQHTGVVRFDLVQDAADPGRFYIYEAFADEAARDAQLRSCALQEYRDSIRDWVAAPPRVLARGISLFSLDAS